MPPSMKPKLFAGLMTASAATSSAVKATPISARQRILDFYREDYKGLTLAPASMPSPRP